MAGKLDWKWRRYRTQTMKQTVFTISLSPALGGRRKEARTRSMVTRQGRMTPAL